MTTQFPGNLDNFTNPAAADKLNSPSHAAQHGNINDAMEAVQAYLGTMVNPAPGTITDRIIELEAGGGGGGGTLDSVDANEGLTITGSSLGTVYNTTIDDSVQSIAVGGAPAQPASVWKLKNLVQVLDAILFPDVAPTYTIPTITISGNESGLREIGEVITQALTSLATKNDAGAFSRTRTRRNTAVINTNASPTPGSIADIPPQFGFPSPNNPNQTFTAVFSDASFAVPSGVTTWSAIGDYLAGLPKRNNKGVNDARAAAVRSVDAPQAAAVDFATATITVTGIHPFFWGVSNTQPTAASIAASITAGTANRVLADSTGTVSVIYNAASQFVWVATPSTSTAKTRWFNTELNQGAVGAGQFILAPVLQNVNSPQSRWSAVPFNIYISGFATTTVGALEFRNS